MSEREYRLDVCPECKVREQDSSEKKLYQCQYCERWFCERHLEPRLASMINLNTSLKDKEWQNVVEKDKRREDGHPDFAYTEKRYNNFQKDKEIYRKRFGEFLDKLPPYEETIPKEPKKEEKLLFKESLIACPKCGSTRTMTTAYRKEFEAFECLSCHHKWKEKLAVAKEEGAYRLIPSRPKSHKVRNIILVISLWMVLLTVLVLFIGLPEFNGLFPRKNVPVASFIPSKTTDIFTGENIIFNASSSYDPDNTKGKGIVTYKWDFGDGKTIETVSSNTVTHYYALIKRYNVTLTVIDDDGQNATYSTGIEVKWEVPSVSQLKNWLTLDKTNEMTYHYPDFVCHDFAEMLANHSRQKNWKMAFVSIEGYDTATLESWNHAINAINTTEGLVYIEPQTDEVWWCNNHAQMVSGNTYNFWSPPYQTVSVHINNILVLSLEDLDKYQFSP